LEDRSVPIVLQRKGAGETVTRLRSGGSRAHLAELAQRLARWAKDQAGRLGHDPAMPEALNDRQQDICVPLLAIADQAGGDWPDRARRALLDLFNRQREEGATMEDGALLLGDIRTIMVDDGALVTPSKELAEKLAAMEERPWPEWQHGKPITPAQLAKALAPFKVRPGNIRRQQGVVKGYRKEMFEDAWARYLPPACVSGDDPPF